MKTGPRAMPVARSAFDVYATRRGSRSAIVGHAVNRACAEALLRTGLPFEENELVVRHGYTVHVEVVGADSPFNDLGEPYIRYVLIPPRRGRSVA